MTLRERAKIVAICDRDKALLNRRGEAWGVESRYTDYRELLAQSRADALSICTPHDLHAQMAVAAAEAGKDILVEKPLARNLEEADAMIDAARKRGVTLMVAENVRFSEFFLKARELVENGYLGDILLIRISRMETGRLLLQDRPWFLDAKQAGGGIMMSGGVHDFEVMRMLVGEIREVFTYRARKAFLEMEGDDSSVAIVKFESGAVGVVMESFSVSDLRSQHAVEIRGSAGSLTMDTYGPRLMSLYSQKLNDLPGEARVNAAVPEGNTFVAEMTHFVDCVESEQVPITSGAEERKPLEVVLAAYESMETGRRVELP
jgi:predicted dehydrogenase